MLLIDWIFWISYFAMLYLSVFLFLILVEKGEDENVHRKKTVSTNAEVSVIVPAYNEEKTLAKTLDSLISLDYPKDKLEIIVVNDGSTDDTEKIANVYRSKGVKVVTQKNMGKGAAMNNGLKHARGKFVACLDADSFVSSSILKDMLSHFTDNSIAAVTPIMKVYNPSNMLQRIQKYEYIIYIYYKKLLSHINAITVTPGPFSIYRTAVLREIGGFDENSIVEDQEIAYRMQKHHYRIVQSSNGEVFTVAPANLRELYKQRSRWYRGTLITLYDYKSMLFNREYGDLGYYNLPSNLMGLPLIFITILFFAYYNVVPWIRTIQQWMLVNFEPTFSFNFKYFMMDVQNFVTDFVFFMDYGKLFVIVAMFAITMTFITKAHKFVNERLTKKSVLPLGMFLVFYYLLLSFLWVGSIIELAVHTRKW